MKPWSKNPRIRKPIGVLIPKYIVSTLASDGGIDPWDGHYKRLVGFSLQARNESLLQEHKRVMPERNEKAKRYWKMASIAGESMGHCDRCGTQDSSKKMVTFCHYCGCDLCFPCFIHDDHSPWACIDCGTEGCGYHQCPPKENDDAGEIPGTPGATPQDIFQRTKKF